MFIWNWVTGNAWQESLDYIYGELLKFFGEFFASMNNMGAEIFDLSWIKAIVLLFSYIGWALFLVGIVVAVFDVAIKAADGKADIKDTALNIIKGFMAVGLFTVLPVELYKLSISLQALFGSELASLLQVQGSSIGTLAQAAINSSYFKYSVLFNIFLLIALGYCIIKIFFANIKRGGILLILIAVGSLYMFSVPRGMTDGFIGWTKQVIALCLTAFLQTTMLMAGLITWSTDVLLGIGIMLAASEVPRIAEKFGLDTSSKVNFMSTIYTAKAVIGMGQSVARMIK